MTGTISENSTLEMKEIGALFGAVVSEQDARVGGFGDDFREVSMHTDTPILQRPGRVRSLLPLSR